MVDMVQVEALKPFTEYVPGRGMVIFATAKPADRERGKEARKATQAELPADLAEDRVRRGYAKAIGRGAGAVNKSSAVSWRERRLRAREDRRALASADGALGGPDLDRKAEGEPAPPNDDDRQALSEAQEDLAKGDDLQHDIARADGLGTQTGSGAPRLEAEGETSLKTADTVGDGASSVLPQGVIKVEGDGLAFKSEAEGEDEDEDKPEDDGSESTDEAAIAAAADAKPRAKRTTAKRTTRKRGAGKARAKGGETATATDAPAE